MAQYLLGIYQPDGTPPPEVLARMGETMREVKAVVDELKDAGAWVFNGGLFPPETATVLRVQADGLLITDGPYTEGKEHLGGFVIVRADDLDGALTWGGRLARVLGLPIEVRPFAEPAG